ncbi:MAG: hypothetical protein AAGF93_13630 [Cyanobacteria bacterium P01_H01_bin.105]
MQQLYLHIGIHKTGTSYIQRCLSLNTDFLEKLECCYPSEEIIYNSGHHNLPWSYLNQPLVGSSMEPEDYQRHFYQKLAKSPYKSFIISSEEFDRLESNNIDSLAQQLDKYGFQAKVIIYIRRQDRLLISLYQELIKHGETIHFKPWLASLIENGYNAYYCSCFNYLNLVRTWLDYFENVEVVVYDNLNLLDRDIFHFFLQTCFGDNNDFSSLALPSERSINPSLDLFFIEILRRINSIYKTLPENNRKPYLKFRQEVLSSLTQWNFILEKVDINSIFGDFERRVVLGQFHATNQELLHQYRQLIANPYNADELFEAQVSHGSPAAYPDLAEALSKVSINDWLELLVRAVNN